jgi:multidrug resistance protein MdtO
MILWAALGAVPFFWNQLAVLYNEEDRDFLTEPGLIEMRRKAAARLDAMAGAVVDGTGLAPVQAASLANPDLLASPRYGEYARNTLAAYEELQGRVLALLAPQKPNTS